MKKTPKQLKYKVKLTANPAWVKQFAVVKKEIAKLSKMEVYTVSYPK